MTGKQLTYVAVAAWTAAITVMVIDSWAQVLMLEGWAAMLAIAGSMFTVLAHRVRHMVKVKEAFRYGSEMAEIVSLDEVRRQRAVDLI